MLIKQTNDAGEEVEVEVFSQEELDTKLQEKDTEYAGKLQEKETALNSLSTEKEALEKKLGETKEDNPNFKILKDALSKKDDEIKKINETITNERTQRVTEELDLKIKALSKGNQELEKKVKLNMTSTLSGMPEDTAENRQKKLEAAFKLSADHISDVPGMFDSGIPTGAGSGAGGAGFGGESKVEFTGREKALGAKLGITPEDYKKYGPKVK